MNCTSLLLPPSSIPSHSLPSPRFCVLPLPPPPVPSVDSRRLLVSSARRRETSAARDRWRHQQQKSSKSATSRFRHPRSAPPATSTSSQSALFDLRQRLAAYGYGTDSSSDDSDVPCRKPARQFPLLEQEVRKRNLTPRLPYYVKVEVEEEERMDYPSHHPSSSQTLFKTAWGAGIPSSPSPSVCPRARALRQERGQRFFIHPEWPSEAVGWQRFLHHTTPARFRHSWI